MNIALLQPHGFSLKEASLLMMNADGVAKVLIDRCFQRSHCSSRGFYKRDWRRYNAGCKSASSWVPTRQFGQKLIKSVNTNPCSRWRALESRQIVPQRLHSGVYPSQHLCSVSSSPAASSPFYDLATNEHVECSSRSCVEIHYARLLAQETWWSSQYVVNWKQLLGSHENYLSKYGESDASQDLQNELHAEKSLVTFCKLRPLEHRLTTCGRPADEHKTVFRMPNGLYKHATEWCFSRTWKIQVSQPQAFHACAIWRLYLRLRKLGFIRSCHSFFLCTQYQHLASIEAALFILLVVAIDLDSLEEAFCTGVFDRIL